MQRPETGYMHVLEKGRTVVKWRRRELTESLLAANNPLVARVVVNRLWHHLYGEGLVPTVDNFGHLGEKPTHPQLLDYLAARFVREGWSIKRMVRYLATTRGK